MSVLYSFNKCSNFAVVSLSIDLIVRQYGREIVAQKEKFFRLVTWTQFFHWDAEYGGGSGRKGKLFHLRKSIDT